jgi:DNA-binding NtrC family response regulator
VAKLPVVLFVDDDRELLESWQMAAQGAPFQFRFAGGSDQALAVAAAEHLDVVVADYRIPGPMDGIGLLERIGHRWPEVERILISGSPPVGLEQLANVRVLLKPCSLHELLATLRALVSGGGALPSA